MRTKSYFALPSTLWDIIISCKAMLLGTMMLLATTAEAKQWTLKECIDYALKNNISIGKQTLTKLSAHEDVLQAQAQMLPSLSASTSQNFTYRPFPETGAATVANGYVQQSVDKVYYNGSYSVNANWTVWDANKRKNQIKLNQLSESMAAADSAIQANSIQEQILNLYVPILYSEEAIKVNKQSLVTSKKNEQRGEEMVKVGKMSQADLAQLTAQRAQDEYNIVAAEANTRNYKRQLKALLELTDDEEFDVVVPETTDDEALEEVPGLQDVYSKALDWRPEIQSQKIALDQSSVNMSIAKASNLPTVSAEAGVGTNTTTMSHDGWGAQLKSNLNFGAGVTVSIPIFDQRQRRTAMNKAEIQRQTALLEMKNQQTQLYSNIENYWIQAITNQSKFKAAKVSVQSQEKSYELLSEQFRLGLKNIVELMTGKTNLVQAQQNELESKYLAILNQKMLDFYSNGTIK